MSLEQSNPLVTVYIPTYNRVELLKRAVESVRHQTYQNLEIIIVDDCSKDGTHAYLEEIKKQDSRIRYFIKDKNSGACVSRNIAINKANGKYITGLDDDDYFLKNRIQNFMNAINLFDKYIILYSNNLIKRKSGLKGKSYKKIIKKSIIAKDLLYINYIGNQVFMETLNIKKFGKFNEKAIAWQDLDHWYRILNLSNKRALCIDNETYVQDCSHDFERITRSKKEKIIKAYNDFIEFNLLNDKESLILKGHLIGYGIKVEWNSLKIRFLSRDFYTFMVNSKLFLRNLLNAFKR